MKTGKEKSARTASLPLTGKGWGRGEDASRISWRRRFCLALFGSLQGVRIESAHSALPPPPGSFLVAKSRRGPGQALTSPRKGEGNTARRLLLRIAFVCFLMFEMSSAPAFAVTPDEVLSDPALEARARSLSAQLRCLVCQNQSIDDSDAPLAKDQIGRAHV